jgi:hypothetical protein
VRTEQLLRDALHSVADQARTPEAVMSRISAGLAGRPRRQRRTMVLVVAVAVIVVTLAIAVPSFLVNRTAVPADQRVPGNWNLIHRVDPPDGWVVREHYVGTDRESTMLGPAGAPAEDATGDCSVEVAGRGVVTDPVPADAKPVDINGRPGFAVRAQQQGLIPDGVFWLYADDAWAWVTCNEEGTTRALEIARRTRFGPEPFASGLRLRRLPSRYVANSIVQSTMDGRPVSALILRSTDPDADPRSITIGVLSGTATVPPGLPGYEEDRIAGHPAVLSGREMWLALNVDGYTVRIEARGGEPADLTRSVWPAGRRELLVSVAENLKLARDLGNPQTWFDAQDAFPR